MQILSGYPIAQKILKQLKSTIKKQGIKIGLAAILVGNDPASLLYINLKEKAAKEIGINFKKYLFPTTTKEKKVIGLIQNLNCQKQIQGIIIQLPLPKHLDENNILSVLDPKKDVDGISPLNLGKMILGNNGILPATALAILKLVESTKIPLSGKHIVIIGRSIIVGKPTALLFFLQKNTTVTLCHSYTQNLENYTNEADILISAVGKPGFINASMVKKGVVVIDAGINKVGNKIIGDVDFENVKRKVKALSPVPGGVGPVTVAMLLANTLRAARLLRKR